MTGKGRLKLNRGRRGGGRTAGVEYWIQISCLCVGFCFYTTADNSIYGQAIQYSPLLFPTIFRSARDLSGIVVSRDVSCRPPDWILSGCHDGQYNMGLHPGSLLPASHAKHASSTATSFPTFPRFFDFLSPKTGRSIFPVQPRCMDGTNPATTNDKTSQAKKKKKHRRIF